MVLHWPGGKEQWSTRSCFSYFLMQSVVVSVVQGGAAVIPTMF